MPLYDRVLIIVAKKFTIYTIPLPRNSNALLAPIIPFVDLRFLVLLQPTDLKEIWFSQLEATNNCIDLCLCFEVSSRFS